MNGCKNCPAYAKCTETYRGSGCAALRYTYGVDFDPEIVTNADHIRAMSDEELYVFLSGINFAECECPARDICVEANSCANVFVDWLKQTYDEAHND